MSFLPQEFTEMQIAKSCEHGERILLLMTVRKYLWEEMYFQSHSVQVFSWAGRLDVASETLVKSRLPIW